MKIDTEVFASHAGYNGVADKMVKKFLQKSAAPSALVLTHEICSRPHGRAYVLPALRASRFGPDLSVGTPHRCDLTTESPLGTDETVARLNEARRADRGVAPPVRAGTGQDYESEGRRPGTPTVPHLAALVLNLNSVASPRNLAIRRRQQAAANKGASKLAHSKPRSHI
jgi:hypothetical protein